MVERQLTSSDDSYGSRKFKQRRHMQIGNEWAH